MNLLIISIHVIASIALIAIVLLQTGKGAEMGAAFGGASQTLFGGTGGTTFMSKLTTAAAVIFMITSLLLSYRPSTHEGRSIMKDMPIEQSQPQQQPLLPEARPVQPDSAAKQAPPTAQEPAKAQSQADTQAPAAKSTPQQQPPAAK